MAMGKSAMEKDTSARAKDTNAIGLLNTKSRERLTAISAWLVIVYAGVIALVSYLGSEGEPQRVRISVSLAAPFVVAALVALWAKRSNCLWLIMPAGAAIIPAAIISVVTWPLWIFAVLMVVAGWHHFETSSFWKLAISLAVILGIFAAIFSLLVSRDPIEWHSGGTHHFSDNTITAIESLLSAGFLGVVIIVALFAIRSSQSDIATSPTPTPADLSDPTPKTAS